MMTINPASSATTRLTILLPVRNERLNLKIMLKILKAITEIPHEVIVIHDHDEDTSIGTVLAMQKEYETLRIVKNNLGTGIPNAVRTGVEHANGEYVLLFAADEIGPVLSIEEMLDLMDDGCEFVSCTRYAHGGRRLGGSFLGGIASRIANRLFYTLSGSALTDATTGIKMFKRTVFPRLGLEAKPVGWSVAFEMSMKAQLIGLRLGEVPIVSIDRLYGGKSTFSFGSWMIEYLVWFLWGSLRMRKKCGWKRPPCQVKLPYHIREED